jgi:hypothetical protein
LFHEMAQETKSRSPLCFSGCQPPAFTSMILTDTHSNILQFCWDRLGSEQGAPVETGKE